MLRAYLYIRFSTAEQAEGDSEHRQRRLANDFIRQHRDLDLELTEDRIFIDAGVSSYKGENRLPDKQLGKLVAALASGKIPKGSYLLTESLDRLSREEPKKAHAFFLSLIERGITIATTSPTESHVYGGQAALTDLIWMLVTSERANQESALKAKRVKDAWIAKRSKASNRILTRVCPHWLKPSTDGKRFEVIEDRAAIVREIFVLAETMGYHSVARYLNEKKVPPFTLRSKGWQSSTIAKILSSPSVIGTFQPRSILRVQGIDGPVRRTKPEGPPIENYYPAVVSHAAFDRLQHIKASRTDSFAGRRGKKASNLFTHVATCGRCGSSMAMVMKGNGAKAGSQNGKYLVCSRGRRGAGCEYRSWPYEALESAFLEYCQNVDLSDVADATALDDRRLLDLRKKEAELQGRIRSTGAAISNTMASIALNGGAVPKAIQDFMVKGEHDIESARAELAALQVEIGEEESRQVTQQNFSVMFANVKSKLADTSGPELFHLRSRLAHAIRHSVITMKLDHVSKQKSEKLCKVLTDCPKITHQLRITFRVGVVRIIYFNRHKPALVVDNEDSGANLNYYQVLPDGKLDCIVKITSEFAARKDDKGQWIKFAEPRKAADLAIA